MRAASTAWMLDGSAASPVSAPTATRCSRNSGLPSAVSTIRAAVPDPSAPAPTLVTSAPRLGVRERLQQQHRPVGLRGEPSRGAAPGDRAARGRRSAARARSRTPSGTRAGRAAWTRPSGRRRRPPRARAPPPRARASGGRPRTSPPPGPTPSDEADRGEHHLRDRLVAVEQLADPLAAAELADDLGERAVGHALAVGRAAADDHGGVVADCGDQLLREARLAHPGRADDGHRVAVLLARARGRTTVRSVSQLAAAVPRTGSADERAIAAPSGVELEQPPCRLAVRFQRARRAPRRGPGGGCRRRAGSRPPARRPARRAATPNASPAAKRERRAPALTKTSPDSTPSLMPSRTPRSRSSAAPASRSSTRRPDGAQRVVLVHLGLAEHAHDGIADEPLHACRRAARSPRCRRPSSGRAGRASTRDRAARRGRPSRCRRRRR